MDSDPTQAVGSPQGGGAESFVPNIDAWEPAATDSEGGTADQGLAPCDEDVAEAAEPPSGEGMEQDRDTVAGAAPEPEVSPLALVLTGRRRPFLRELARGGLSIDLRRAVRLAADPFLDEAAAAAAIAQTAAESPDQPDAITACGAVAARIVARALQRSLGPLDPLNAEALLLAAHDAAQAIAVARGGNGLRMLPPLAELVARRAVARGATATGVADVMRRIAARIAGDPSLGSGLAQDPFAEHRPRGKPGPPGRLVLHGPVEIAVHARSLG